MSSPSKPSFAEHLTSSQKLGRVSLVWEDIDMAIVVPDSSKSTIFHKVKKSKRILKSVSGKAVSGELLAIMGPTGMAFTKPPKNDNSSIIIICCL